MHKRGDEKLPPRLIAVLGLVSLAVIQLSHMAFDQALSADLLAVWMAGRNFAAGNLDQIYAASSGLFLMLPPEGWQQQVLADGYDRSIYPFIYPPLWAVLAAGVTRLAEFSTVALIASYLNPALLLATLWLALRNVVPSTSFAACYLLGIALLGSGLSALIALDQNQPQILVAFLTVLAIDRQRKGAPLAAGAALALAASIKAYPALFVLFWLARGQYRPAAAFAGVGAALGLASLLAGGWPLHQEFLQQLSDISDTVVVTYFSWSLDPTLAQAFYADQLIRIADLGRVPEGEFESSWWVMPKPALWRGLDLALMLSLLGALTFWARRSDGILFWPAALTLLSLVMPLSWGYHYLAPLAFAPALIVRFGVRPGVLALLLVFGPQMAFLFDIDPVLAVWKYVAQPVGTLSMVAYASLLILATRQRRPTANQPLPLRPRSGPL